ncbi:hypothetical protein [Mesobacterium pallidum]|uniref:hypothetical protein n=1 Tax=Mesobacterium pallidum TaxID=2872037 RepID=UPI001EE23486|nr:hypothetical protein [Mesobacterium pallidum]
MSTNADARPTKPAADEAIVRLYGQLVDMAPGEDDDVPEDARLMMTVADVRAIIRDRNNLEQSK